MIIHVVAGKLVVLSCKWLLAINKFDPDVSMLRNAYEYSLAQVCLPHRIIVEYLRVSTLPFVWESDS